MVHVGNCTNFNKSTKQTAWLMDVYLACATAATPNDDIRQTGIILAPSQLPVTSLSFGEEGLACSLHAGVHTHIETFLAHTRK